LHAEAMRPLDAGAQAESDRILRDLQQVMFAYDVGILKSAERLEAARQRIEALTAELAEVAAPHVHELVRIKETEAMLLAAKFILGASLYRPESRLSHFREVFAARDDKDWLVWVDIAERNGAPVFTTTPIPTPLCGVEAIRGGPARLRQRNAVAGP